MTKEMTIKLFNSTPSEKKGLLAYRKWFKTPISKAIQQISLFILQKNEVEGKQTFSKGNQIYYNGTIP